MRYTYLLCAEGQAQRLTAAFSYLYPAHVGLTILTRVYGSCSTISAELCLILLAPHVLEYSSMIAAV